MLLKIRRRLRIWADLEAIIGFKDLLRPVIEPAVPKEYADASCCEIIPAGFGKRESVLKAGAAIQESPSMFLADRD